MAAPAPRLKTQYEETIRPKLQEEFSYGNVMQIPRLNKISLNLSLKDAIQNVKVLEQAAGELTLIAGQKAIPVDAAGCYVPGGRYSHIASAIMTV